MKIMINKFHICGLFLILASFALSNCQAGYVVCPDNKSACDDNKVCCKKNTGYSCCPSTLCCCNDGSYCCACSSFLRIDLFSKKTGSQPSFYLKENSKEVLDKNEIPSSKKLNLLGSYKNITESKFYKEQQSNAIYGAYLVLDSFLNETQYFKFTRNFYPQNLAGCKEEIGVIINNVLIGISNLNNKTLILEPIQYLTKLTSTTSEIFYHSRELIRDCKQIPREIKYMMELISNYLKNSDPITGQTYIFKFFTNLEKNLLSIFSYFSQISDDWAAEKYRECGENLGKLFNIMFEI